MAKGQKGKAAGPFFEHYGQTSKRLPDPYIDAKGYPEPNICPICRLVYHKKRWHQNEAEAKLVLSREAKVNKHKCPACRKIEDHYPMGVVNISGDFVTEHFEELVNLVKSEERRAREKNPLERLMKIDKVDGGIYVETTSDALAMRIGHVLHRAYKGDTDFKFRYGDKYVIVDWSRG